MSVSPFRVYSILLVGIGTVSFSAIFIRLAQSAGGPSYTIAAWRLIFASIILFPIAWNRHKADFLRLTPSTIAYSALAGVLLGVHLVAWVASLRDTSVAVATTLCCTTPLWTALLGYFFFGEALRTAVRHGMMVAVFGSVLLAVADLESPAAAHPWIGGVEAVFSAIAASGYLLVGRKVRQHTDLLVYIWLAYVSGAITLLAFSPWAPSSLFGHPWESYGWTLLLALGPQILGHTIINWSLRHVSPTMVSICNLGEPIGAATLAWLIFGESIGSFQGVALVVILAGILRAILR